MKTNRSIHRIEWDETVAVARSDRRAHRVDHLRNSVRAGLGSFSNPYGRHRHPPVGPRSARGFQRRWKWKAEPFEDRGGEVRRCGGNSAPSASTVPSIHERGFRLDAPAGLLALGSSRPCAFPPQRAVAILQDQSPTTAAGPQRLRTVFPMPHALLERPRQPRVIMRLQTLRGGSVRCQANVPSRRRTSALWRLNPCSSCTNTSVRDHPCSTG